MSENVAMSQNGSSSEQVSPNDSVASNENIALNEGIFLSENIGENVALKRSAEQSELSETAGEDSSVKKLKNASSSTEEPAKKVLYENANLSLSLIKLKQIIDIRTTEKSAVLEGEYEDQRVLLFVEKLPFDEQTLRKLFEEPFELTKILQNDIYGSYSLEPPIRNRLKTTIICPATDKHFEKYTKSQYQMIEETAERYRQITLPYLEESKFSIDWVYNILEHKQEAERIVYEDADDKAGFILLPDLKWDGRTMKKLYLMAIVRRRDIRSIRDLTGEHLPLLENIKQNGYRVIKEKYGIDPDYLQVYFHYQPSYYHLHIHFNTIHYDHPRLFVGSSHLLDTVISNLQIDTDYYKKATLTFRSKCSFGITDYYRKKLAEQVEDARDANDEGNGEALE